LPGAPSCTDWGKAGHLHPGQGDRTLYLVSEAETALGSVHRHRPRLQGDAGADDRQAGVVEFPIERQGAVLQPLFLMHNG
jgi:hypothetical protein